MTINLLRLLVLDKLWHQPAITLFNICWTIMVTVVLLLVMFTSRNAPLELSFACDHFHAGDCGQDNQCVTLTQSHTEPHTHTHTHQSLINLCQIGPVVCRVSKNLTDHLKWWQNTFSNRHQPTRSSNLS